MTINSKIDKKQLAVNIAVPLGLGLISSLLTKNGMKEFASINQPPLTPPPWVFAVAWTILYILMGISSYIIKTHDKDPAKNASAFYTLQLAVNLTWPLIFFGAKAYLFAFIWLLILWVLSAVMVFLFWKIDKTAAVLQIPYLIWLTFAAYLNFGVYVLN
ncbi:MAG: tryptophan-rich sensory protein [Clostridia bacterium]|nr:tryptophan-rich sensory protein [Clostridia bacterium]